MVYGLGPIGQMSVRVAKHLGVERVIGVDLVPERLELARRYGAEVIDWENEGDPVAEILESTSGRGADAVIDAVGMEAHGAPVVETVQAVLGKLPEPNRSDGDGESRYRPHIGAPCRHTPRFVAAARCR